MVIASDTDLDRNSTGDSRGQDLEMGSDEEEVRGDIDMPSSGSVRPSLVSPCHLAAISRKPQFHKLTADYFLIQLSVLIPPRLQYSCSDELRSVDSNHCVEARVIMRF
jgi:hypothetical protein